jgi:hypothetical protein
MSLFRLVVSFILIPTCEKSLSLARSWGLIRKSQAQGRSQAASSSLLSIGQGIKRFSEKGREQLLQQMASEMAMAGLAGGRFFYLTETEVETQIAIDRDSNKEVGLSPLDYLIYLQAHIQ